MAKNFFDDATTKYYCFENISMPLMCDKTDKFVLVVQRKSKSTKLKGYEMAYGYPTLTKAKADLEAKSENDKYLVSIYKLYATRQKC